MKRIGRAGIIALLLALLLVVGGGLWVLGDSIRRELAGPSPETIASASLAGLREQNRLVTFSARYVAVVTSKQSRLGMTAQKTLIMPGTVRYEIDLAKLQQDDVRWDPAAKQLTVALPAIEVVGPEVEIDAIRQYSNGGLLMRFTDVEAKLDAANRKAGKAELVRQAREPTPMKLARESARRAVERSFAMPLRAVGVEASVRALFPEERGGRDDERWDVSRSVEDVLANRW